MEPHGNDLKIEVRADIEIRDGKPHLIIVISDNGMGFDSNELGTESVGLANIVERLELFDSRSFFQITSKPGQGCRCEIVLPVDNEDEEDDYEDDDTDFAYEDEEES